VASVIRMSRYNLRSTYGVHRLAFLFVTRNSPPLVFAIRGA
jgi:hypothetical protein